MTQNYYDELKRQAKLSKAFQYMEGPTWKVCTDLSIMPYHRQTLGNFLELKEKAYNDRIEKLEGVVEKQQAIINELTQAVRALNK